MTIEDNIAALPRQMEPIIQDNLLINFTTEFNRVWSSNGSKAKPATFWRPAPAPDALPGYFPLGDVLIPGDANINGEVVAAVVCERDLKGVENARGKALARPVERNRGAQCCAPVDLAPFGTCRLRRLGASLHHRSLQTFAQLSALRQGRPRRRSEPRRVDLE